MPVALAVAEQFPVAETGDSNTRPARALCFSLDKRPIRDVFLRHFRRSWFSTSRVRVLQRSVTFEEFSKKCLSKNIWMCCVLLLSVSTAC